VDDSPDDTKRGPPCYHASLAASCYRAWALPHTTVPFARTVLHCALMHCWAWLVRHLPPPTWHLSAPCVGSPKARTMALYTTAGMTSIAAIVWRAFYFSADFIILPYRLPTPLCTRTDKRASPPPPPPHLLLPQARACMVAYSISSVSRFENTFHAFLPRPTRSHPRHTTTHHGTHPQHALPLRTCHARAGRLERVPSAACPCSVLMSHASRTPLPPGAGRFCPSPHATHTHPSGAAHTHLSVAVLPLSRTVQRCLPFMLAHSLQPCLRGHYLPGCL